MELLPSQSPPHQKATSYTYLPQWIMLLSEENQKCIKLGGEETQEIIN